MKYVVNIKLDIGNESEFMQFYIALLIQPEKRAIQRVSVIEISVIEIMRYSEYTANCKSVKVDLKIAVTAGRHEEELVSQ